MCYGSKSKKVNMTVVAVEQSHQAGGGGDGSPDGTGGSEDESFAGMFRRESPSDFSNPWLYFSGTLPLSLFVFVGMCTNRYIYILTGEELTKLARDYIKYIFGGTQSVRLKSAMVRWGLFYQSLTEKKEVDEYWLEKAILNTPTWWYDPEDFREAVRNCLWN
ncbi:hypothetical protein SESBI_15938 [Sesbania bispinosa]|nr:hypothetical protein SESBI_15938 [Sesbania bispinosa]